LGFDVTAKGAFAMIIRGLKSDFEKEFNVKIVEKTLNITENDQTSIRYYDFDQKIQNNMIPEKLSSYISRAHSSLCWKPCRKRRRESLEQKHTGASAQPSVIQGKRLLGNSRTSDS
jgi:hypothetical protein